MLIDLGMKVGCTKEELEKLMNGDAPEYMEKIWKIADDLGLNTLLLPVSWELTEPEEGVFDFSIPDALIRQAREWKNA